jgi:hypothetical protein
MKNKQDRLDPFHWIGIILGVIMGYAIGTQVHAESAVTSVNVVITAEVACNEYNAAYSDQCLTEPVPQIGEGISTSTEQQSWLSRVLDLIKFW